MKSWPFFFLILLAGQPVAHGQGADTATRQGDEALAAGLWEVAELHYRESLAAPSLTPEEKSSVAIRLAEALVRTGDPAAALDVLGQSFVAENPAVPFWRAQAFATQKRFAEAIDIFAGILADPAAPHRPEAALTSASLSLALDQPQDAIDSLARVLPHPDPATDAKVRLHQVEILLDLGRTAAARANLPATEAVAQADRALAAFLGARLLLMEEKPAEAEAAFAALLRQSSASTVAPRGLSVRRHHAAAIGLADALHAGGNTDAATKSLLAFISNNRTSPLLDAMFERILRWLPEKPAASDPVLEQLAAWITPPVLPATGVINVEANPTGAAAEAAWPDASAAPPPELLAHALFTRAVGLQRIGTPEALAGAGLLINRLRVGFPGHPLAGRALYHQARGLLERGESERAFAILGMLRENTAAPAVQGRAAFLEARAAYQKGDHEQAVRLFEQAAVALDGDSARTARLQAAIARLRSGESGATTLVQAQETPDDDALAADLELERALAATPPAKAKELLAGFIGKFPEHPRLAEARLAAAEAALANPDPDPAFAGEQLDALVADAEKADNLPPLRIALARLRITDLAGDPAATIAAARSIVETFPLDQGSAEAALTLGRNLFQTGDYNSARLALEKLAASDTDPARAQAAWLLAARAAALGGTPQSKADALVLFDKAIEAGGPVSDAARLEKARHLIDSFQLPEATEFLRKWTAVLPEDDPLRLPAGLMLGEALYAQGSTRPGSLVEALEVYDGLLVHAKTYPSLANRLHYLRGTTLERLPDEADPSKKRVKEAFQAYYSVLETSTPPSEWEYFERAGFRALALLEMAERWQAAISVAKKIASFGGPRAEEAAKYADELDLKYPVW